MSSLFRLAAAAASLTIAVPLLAQAGASPPDAVEGATPDRVALVNACGGHKFETLVEIDPVKHRSTRVKLCSKPDGTDADWVKTLNAAIAQIELRTMPPAARDQLIAELQAEAAKYEKIAPAAASGINLGKNSLAGPSLEPEAPFIVSSLPPLPNPKGKAVGASAPKVAVKPIRATVKCLSRGETGKGSSCDFFDKDTVLVMTAGAGLEDGATLRFLRRGEDRGTVEIGALTSGQARRIALPSGICRGIAHSKVELQLVAPNATMPGATLGPYGLRC